ncbi:hypothetical protein [Cellvibrio sp.]|jgi:hypothetical protein
MNSHNHEKNSPDVKNPQGNFLGDKCSGESVAGNNASPHSSASWASDVAQTLQLGEELVGFIGGVVDLARVEALLAIRTFPKLIMLWLLMMPVMLLTWCAFSTLMAWSVFAASGQVGLGMLTFFLLQVLLLLVCRLLFVKYRTRMTLPCTRLQIDCFVRSMQDGINGRDKAKE